MKTHIYITLFFVFLITNLYSKNAFKEVTYDCEKNLFLFDGIANVVPCIEGFYIKPINVPEGTTKIEIKIYNSKDDKKNGYPIVRDKIVNTITINITPGAKVDLSGWNGAALERNRWYHFEIIITASNPKTNSTKAYASPPRNEISHIEFFGGIGAVGFSQKKIKDIKYGLGLATGLKIKLKPVSTNPNINRYQYYPKKSKFSLIVATMINDLTYRGTDLKSPILGLKPVIGLDYEFTKNLGIGLSTVLVNQETKSKLTTQNNLSIGIFLCLSFSSDVFEAFKKNTAFAPKI